MSERSRAKKRRSRKAVKARIRAQEPLGGYPTPRQLKLLRFYATRARPPSFRQVCDFMGFTLNAAWEMQGSLIRRGLLDKEVGVAKGCWVTDKGREVLGESRREHSADME